MEQCVISFTSGRPVVLKSASYTGPQMGRDQSPEYAGFVRELVHRLAKIQPETRFTRGSAAVVVAWTVVGLLGAGLLAIGLAVLLSPLFTNDAFAEVFPLGLMACIAGAVVALMGWGMMKSYCPSHTTVGELTKASLT